MTAMRNGTICQPRQPSRRSRPNLNRSGFVGDCRVWRYAARADRQCQIPIVSFLRFSRRHVPERAEQPMVVVPVYPFERRELDVLQGPVLAIMNQSGSRPAFMQRLVERVQHEVGAHRRRHPPANDTTGEHVGHEGHIDEARPRPAVGKIRHPQGIGPISPELALDLVQRTRYGIGALRRLDPAPAPYPFEAHRLRQAGHRTASDLHAVTQQLVLHLAHAVHAEVFVPDRPDEGLQFSITARACRPLLRIAASLGVTMIRRRRDRQHSADRLDTVDVTMRVDERDHGFDRRSKSA